MGKTLSVMIPHAVELEDPYLYFGDYDSLGIFRWVGRDDIVATDLEQVNPQLGRLYREAKTLHDERNQLCLKAHDEGRTYEELTTGDDTEALRYQDLERREDVAKAAGRAVHHCQVRRRRQRALSVTKLSVYSF